MPFTCQGLKSVLGTVFSAGIVSSKLTKWSFYQLEIIIQEYGHHKMYVKNSIASKHARHLVSRARNDPRPQSPGSSPETPGLMTPLLATI